MTTQSFTDTTIGIPSVLHEFLLPINQQLDVEAYLRENLGDEFLGAHSSDPHFMNKNFGVLTVKMPNNPPQTNPQSLHWVLTVDRSGSMGDLHKGKSKMDNVKHMLRNLITYLKTLSTVQVPHFITIIGFDHETTVYCEHYNINDAESPTIYTNYVEPIETRGSTNFGAAFDEASEIITRNYSENERIVHIFMTDGNITSGSRNIDTITEKCLHPLNLSSSESRSPPRVFFVGFGIDHNATFIQKLSDNITLSNYYFVENTENAGYVYGEIANEVVKEYVHSITITTEYGEIYDYTTNTWETSLTLTSLPIEVEKTFHIRMDHPKPEQRASHRNIRIIFNANKSNCESNGYSDIRLNSHMLSGGINYPNCGVLKFWWRQKALELLYETRQMLVTEIPYYYEPTTHTRSQEGILIEFLESLKHWETVHYNSGCEQFMQDLCDDIYAAIKSLSTSASIGYMFVNARLNAQGLQRAYNLCDFSALERPRYSEPHQIDGMHVPSTARATSYSSSSQDYSMQMVTGDYSTVGSEDTVVL